MTRDEVNEKLTVTDVEGRMLQAASSGRAWLRYGTCLRQVDADTIEVLRRRKMLWIEVHGPIYSQARLTQVGRIALRRWELERAATRRAA